MPWCRVGLSVSSEKSLIAHHRIIGWLWCHPESAILDAADGIRTDPSADFPEHDVLGV
jgi:hypothetical protein